MYSLKRNLTKGLIINMIVAMLLLLVGMNFTLKHLFEAHILTRLQQDAESLISLIQPTSDNNWSINPVYMSRVYSRVRSGHYYRITTAQQSIRSRSLFDFEFSEPEINPGQTGHYQMKGAGDEQWLVWQQVIYKNNNALNIWIAEDLRPLYQNLLRFSLYAIAIVILITLVSIYLQQKTLDRAFRVFDALRHNLKAIRNNETDSSELQLPLEVTPLVNEINRLLEQLKQRIQRTRQAIANLSHELKRPLQILSLTVDSKASNQTARRAVDEIQAIVERELKRAKISGTHQVGAVLRIQDELPFLLEIMRNIYPAITIETELAAGVYEFNLDRDDMLELLGNLIDNACKFATAKVRFQARSDRSQLTLFIEDDGPGVALDQLASIIEQGKRLDETVAGHGLGLGICSDILAGYRGQLDFSSSGMGGLKVRVRIPLNE